MCVHTQAEARDAHTHTRTHLLSGGENQTLLIPSAFISPTKAGLELFACGTQSLPRRKHTLPTSRPALSPGGWPTACPQGSGFLGGWGGHEKASRSS